MEQSSAFMGNFQISSDFTLYEDVNLRQNNAINLSFSGHMSVNSPLPGTSISEITVFQKFCNLIQKPCIMKRFRKRAKSASLTSTPEKQKIEENLLKISRKEKKEKISNKDRNLNFLGNYQRLKQNFFLENRTKFMKDSYGTSDLDSDNYSIYTYINVSRWKY
ncbi:hypothetical protein AVEN_85635-1 [Araneus ventricosus]|uniref:Uncharacterized protein n=1 Tax=Araneus ventricosus TaxID=182803 RepID=A0A4Y2NX83_ARAVE|nr:hypothetical protein AVEN_85635-1 [Araneus ventricosus]